MNWNVLSTYTFNMMVVFFTIVCFIVFYSVYYMCVCFIFGLQKSLELDRRFLSSHSRPTFSINKNYKKINLVDYRLLLFRFRTWTTTTKKNIFPVFQVLSDISWPDHSQALIGGRHPPFNPAQNEIGTIRNILLTIPFSRGIFRANNRKKCKSNPHLYCEKGAAYRWGAGWWLSSSPTILEKTGRISQKNFRMKKKSKWKAKGCNT